MTEQTFARSGASVSPTVPAMSDEPLRHRSADARSGGDVRASDADRERLVAELNEHTADGRLSTDDLEERVQAAYAAQTTGQLDAIRRDLPPTPRQVALEHRERRAHLTRRMVQETGGSAALFLVCTVVWLVSGANGQFWPVWVLLIVVLSLVRNGWALYGPGADLDAVEADMDARAQRRRSRELDRADRRADRRDRRRLP